MIVFAVPAESTPVVGFLILGGIVVWRTYVWFLNLRAKRAQIRAAKAQERIATALEGKRAV